MHMAIGIAPKEKIKKIKQGERNIEHTSICFVYS